MCCLFMPQPVEVMLFSDVEGDLFSLSITIEHGSQFFKKLTAS
jgi:hypothetical protein